MSLRESLNSELPASLQFHSSIIIGVVGRVVLPVTELGSSYSKWHVLLHAGTRIVA